MEYKSKFYSERSRALANAVRDIKIAAAERNDVVIDMKEADRARLEILAQELQSVFNDVPMDDERFDFMISSGLQPRLWIDATAHVIMGKDRRQYRFVRDSRMGRVVLAEGNETGPIHSAVTAYIAERLHERELAFAGDSITYRAGVSQRSEGENAAENTGHNTRGKSGIEGAVDGGDEITTRADMSEKEKNSKTAMSPIGWLLLGLFIGAGAFLLYFHEAIFLTAL